MGFPFKPLNQRQIKEKLSSVEKTAAELKKDKIDLKANVVIKDFLALKKADITAMTAAGRNILFAKVLKALCWSELDES